MAVLTTVPGSGNSISAAQDDKKPTVATAEGDVEVGSTDLLTRNDMGFKRTLHRRQIMMMTFGAGVGTGLWVGTGTALRYAGPAGTAIAYSIVALLVYEMYMSVGEMTTYKPINGGFIRQAAEYIDPAAGFANGINFWWSWCMIIPSEITAGISVLQFWPQTNVIPLAGWITILLVIMIAANVFEVKLYGEIEFWMSALKCITIVAMIFFMIIMTSGGIAATNGPIEFTYWKNPGAFNNGIRGICKAFIQAGFSFGGGEHIATIAGEAIEPRKTVKATIKPLFWRMCTFFVVNIWLVGMCVPYNDARLANESGTLASPFVIAIERANLMWLAHILNAFIFITVISCGITSIYVASRALTFMADLKLIHECFGKKDSQGRPRLSLLIVSVLGGGLCYLNCNNEAQVVYNWFSSLVGISTFIQWGILYIQHIRFRSGLKAQGISWKTLPFIDRLAPYGQWAGLVMIMLIMIAEFYLAVWPFNAKPSAENFFSTYISAPLYAADYFIYKWWYKTKIVAPEDMDFSEAAWFDEDDRQKAEEEAANPPEKLSLRKRIVAGIAG